MFKLIVVFICVALSLGKDKSCQTFKNCDKCIQNGCVFTYLPKGKYACNVEAVFPNVGIAYSNSFCVSQKTEPMVEDDNSDMEMSSSSEENIVLQAISFIYSSWEWLLSFLGKY